MYTPELLLALALQQEAEYQRLLVPHPPGTINEERNKAYDIARQAEICAAWMESKGYRELASVGPFGMQDFHKGQHVKIRKGAIVHSTDPHHPKEGAPLLRDQVVLLRSVSKGYVNLNGWRSEEQDGARVRNGEVIWAGSGGYWKRTDINNVEPK